MRRWEPADNENEAVGWSIWVKSIFSPASKNGAQARAK